MKISQNFVAFSEYMNFTTEVLWIISIKKNMYILRIFIAEKFQPEKMLNGFEFPEI